ncbi:MAG: rhodanese-like domain-containing protein [Myxococcales bacterium]
MIEIDAKSLQAKLGSVVVLDVRNPPEVQAEGAIEGSILIPMDQLPRRLAEIPHDREVVAVCKRGMRSYNVANWLRSQGRDAVSLQGGIDQWRALGLPLKR